MDVGAKPERPQSANRPRPLINAARRYNTDTWTATPDLRTVVARRPRRCAQRAQTRHDEIDSRVSTAEREAHHPQVVSNLFCSYASYNTHFFGAHRSHLLHVQQQNVFGVSSRAKTCVSLRWCGLSRTTDRTNDCLENASKRLSRKIVGPDGFFCELLRPDAVGIATQQRSSLFE